MLGRRYQLGIHRIVRIIVIAIGIPVLLSCTTLPGNNMMHPPLTDIGPDLRNATRHDGDMNSSCGSNPVIDLMVLYTADALNGEGGSKDAMAAMVASAIDDANTSFVNSDINLKFKLVYLTEVAYEETHNIIHDRDNVHNGLIKDMSGVNVLTLRNQHNADIVVLIVEDGGGPAGFSNQYDGNPDNAYSAIVRKYATKPPYAFTHEVGHVLGANHSRNDALPNNTCTQPLTFPCKYDNGYNHGHVQASPSNRGIPPWHTLMGVNNGCPQCRTILYWSNPNINYPKVDGDPTGVPIGSVDPQPEDNHFRINHTAKSVCEFRPRRFPVKASLPSQLRGLPAQPSPPSQQHLR